MSKRSLLIGGGVSAVALITCGLIFARVIGGGSASQKSLDIAMSLIDQQRWDVAGRIARDLHQAHPSEMIENPAWQYVTGVAKLQSVQTQLDSPAHRKVLHEATEHLAEANRLGFPVGYQGKGAFHLGWCYFHTYRWDRVPELLKRSATLWSERRSDAYEMIVESHLSQNPIDFNSADKTLANWARIPGLSESEQARIAIASAHAESLKGNVDECERLLLGIAPSAPEYVNSLLWRGRWRLKHARESELPSRQHDALLIEAQEIAREVKLAAATPVGIRRQATYLSGLIHRELGEHEKALRTFSGSRQSNPHTAEAIASGIEEAELMLEAGKLDDLLATTYHLLRNIEDISLYNEYWVPVAEFRMRLLEIGRRLRDQAQFERAIKLAEHVALAFPLADSVELQAETLEQWGHYRAQEPAADAEQLRAARDTAKAKFHQAAMLFEELARLQLRSAEYPSIVWRSIVNYQRAVELDKANAMLSEYLKFEDRTKRPRGFLALGKNCMDAARWREALEPLERCLSEYPEHPLSFEARLLAAKTLYELNDLDGAVEMLERNCYDFTLHPDNETWRNSIFQLGKTLFKQGHRLLLETQLDPSVSDEQREHQLGNCHSKFLAAIDRLGEAVSRYPNDPRFLECRYSIAKSYELAAEAQPDVTAPRPSMNDASRKRPMQPRTTLLQQALNEYQSLNLLIQARQEDENDSDHYAAIVRGAYFGEADTLYELGRWEEAVEAYQAITNQYFDQPESLEALLQIANCYRKLDMPQQASQAVAQARQLLNRIPPELDTRFVSLTRTNRQGWSDLIETLGTWD